jgi:hypothetical protein
MRMNMKIPRSKLSLLGTFPGIQLKHGFYKPSRVGITHGSLGSTISPCAMGLVQHPSLSLVGHGNFFYNPPFLPLN